jgi:hypothetical protein
MIYVKGEYKGKPLNLLFDDNGEIYPQFKKAIGKIKKFKVKKLEIIEKVEIVNEAIDLLYLFSKTPITPALAVAEVVSDMVKDIEDTFG